MNRNVGIRGIISPPKSPAEIAEDVKAKAEAMAAVVKKLGPINRHVSVMDPDDFGNIRALEAASKPVRDKFGNTAPQKTRGKLYGDLTKEKDLRKFLNEESATDNELYAKPKNDPPLEAAELKKAEMLVNKANARVASQLTNLKNWANNSKKVVG